MLRDDNDENIYPFAILMPTTSKTNESYTTKLNENCKKPF
jgi:hypothetical protein